MEIKSHVNIVLPRTVSWSALASAPTGRAWAARRRWSRCLSKAVGSYHHAKKMSHTSTELHVLFMSIVLQQEIEIQCNMNKMDMLSVTWFWFVVSAVEHFVAAMFNFGLVVDYAHMYEVMSTCT